MALSADGTVVAFDSKATNLDPTDTDGDPDAYVKDLTTGDLVLASTSDSDVKGNGASSPAALSADGTRVAIYSSATNLDPADTDNVYDVYVKDLTTGDLVLASTSASGTKGNGQSLPVALSADGTRVAFYSSATNLDAGDTDNVYDVYVKDLTTGDLVLASTSDLGVKGNFPSEGSALSADGSRVAFRSYASNLDPADTDSGPDVYVKDLTTGDLVLASTSDSDAKGNSGSGALGLSADGMRVAFSSFATNLDPGDTDNVVDIYVKDLSTGQLVLASTSDSGMKGNGASFGFLSMLSAEGTRAAFYSLSTNLEPADTDNLSDVYVKDLSDAWAVTCSKVDGVLTIGIPANGEASIRRSGDELVVSGTGVESTNCGGARVDNVDAIAATGSTGWERFTVDLSGGAFAPGATHEGSGKSELEFTIDLGADTDHLEIAGSAAKDLIWVGQLGVNLNNDDDVDITLAGTESLAAQGAGGADTLSAAGGQATGAAASLPVTFAGEGGNDTLAGGTAADALDGGTGNDRFDTSKTADGGDTYVGGTGIDTISFAPRTSGVRVSLDGLADDGAQGGAEGDNVGPDLENVTGGKKGDSISDGSQTVGNVFKGGRGSDTLQADDGVSGNDVVDGAGGADSCVADSGDTLRNCE